MSTSTAAPITTTLATVNGIDIVRVFEPAEPNAELDAVFGTEPADFVTYGLRYLNGSIALNVLPVEITGDADAVEVYRTYIERGVASGRLDLSTGKYRFDRS